MSNEFDKDPKAIREITSKELSENFHTPKPRSVGRPLGYDYGSYSGYGRRTTIQSGTPSLSPYHDRMANIPASEVRCHRDRIVRDEARDLYGLPQDNAYLADKMYVPQPFAQDAEDGKTAPKHPIYGPEEQALPFPDGGFVQVHGRYIAQVAREVVAQMVLNLNERRIIPTEYDMMQVEDLVRRTLRRSYYRSGPDEASQMHPIMGFID